MEEYIVFTVVSNEDALLLRRHKQMVRVRVFARTELTNGADIVTVLNEDRLKLTRYVVVEVKGGHSASVYGDRLVLFQTGVDGGGVAPVVGERRLNLLQR